MNDENVNANAKEEEEEKKRRRKDEGGRNKQKIIQFKIIWKVKLL